jgi:hypothetical protein
VTAKIDNHVEAALARLPQQLRDDANTESLIRALVAPAQDAENAGYDLFTLRRIDVAEGATLDMIGAIVGQPRNGVAVDALYRRYIRARIATNRSDGTVEALIRVAGAVLGSITDYTIEVESFPPASVTVRVINSSDKVVSPDVAEILIEFLRDAVAAGILVSTETSESLDDDVFTFDGGTGLGWGDSTDSNVGGVWASVAE